MVSDKKLDVKFGERLSLLRKQEPQKLTQDELAEMMNVSTRTVSTWETGERIPSVGVIAWLADYFEVSMDYIIGRTDWPVFERKDKSGNILYVGSPSIPNAEFEEIMKSDLIPVEWQKKDESEFSGEERAEIREFISLIREFVASRKKGNAG